MSRGCEVELRSPGRSCRIRIGRSPDRELSMSHQINDRRRRNSWSTRLTCSGAVVEGLSPEGEVGMVGVVVVVQLSGCGRNEWNAAVG